VTEPDHEILITVDEAFSAAVAEDHLVELARKALQAEQVKPCELGIVVTDDETIRRLNREYAGEDHVTDVLSFSLQEGEEFISGDPIGRLGEVIISWPTAEQQAAEAQHSVDDELAHLLVHGILHLLGYDHAEEADERVMREREEQLLAFVHDA
jgi:probable rRNA maturation factor